MTHRTAAQVEDAKRYRALGRLLMACKAAGWKITRLEATAHWRVTHPNGGAFVVAPRPTVRGLMVAEVAVRRIEGTNMEELDT